MLKKRERRTSVGTGKNYLTYTFEQAIDYVISSKKAEGLRERTLRDYMKHWGLEQLKNQLRLILNTTGGVNLTKNRADELIAAP